jgi:hypothetical protein
LVAGEAEPLTDAVLWGAPPTADRYALHAWAPKAG